MTDLPPPAKRFAKHKLGVQVHSILWNDWDPIGVNGKTSRYVEIDPDTGEEIGPAPEGVPGGWDDEYDRYAWHVLSLLDEGADAYKIGEYLDQVTTHSMGAPWKDVAAMRTRHRVLAEQIVALRAANLK